MRRLVVRQTILFYIDRKKNYGTHPPLVPANDAAGRVHRVDVSFDNLNFR